MPTEYLRPDAALTTNQYAAGDETSIDDTEFLPPGDESVDGNWLTLSGNAVDADAAGPVSSPSATPTGTVTLHVWVRKYPSADQLHPTLDLYIVDNGTDRASSLGNTVTNATGERFTATVAASSITGGFANLSFRTESARSGGSPTNRRGVEIGAVAFEVDVPAAAQNLDPPAVGSTAGVVAASLAAGAVSLAPPVVASAAAVVAAALSVGPVNLDPPAVGSAAGVVDATLSISQTLDPAVVDSPAAAVDATLGVGAVSLDPPVVGSAAAAVDPSLAIEQLSIEGYRFRNDDGDETSATWAAAFETNISRNTGDKVRLRFLLESNGGADYVSWTKVQFRKNGGAWGDLTGVSVGCRTYDSPNVVDLTPTTQQIGSGTYDTSNNAYRDGSVTTVVHGNVPAGSEVEIECTVELSPGDSTTGDFFEFRVTDVDTGGVVAPGLIPLIGIVGDNLAPPVVSSPAAAVDATLTAQTDLDPGVVGSAAAAVDATLTVGVATLDPAVVSSPAAAVDADLTLSGGAQTLDPDVVASQAAAVDASLAAGAVSLAPPVVGSAAAAVDASLSVGAVSLDPSVEASPAAAVDASLSVGAVSLDPPVVASPASTVDATLELTGAQTLDPPAVGSTAAAVDASLTAGAAPLDPAVVSTPAAAVDATLAAGAVTLEPSVEASPAAAVDASLTAGGVSLDPPVVSSPAQAVDAQILLDGGQTLDPPVVGSPAGVVDAVLRVFTPNAIRVRSRPTQTIVVASRPEQTITVRKGPARTITVKDRQHGD